MFYTRARDDVEFSSRQGSSPARQFACRWYKVQDPLKRVVVSVNGKSGTFQVVSKQEDWQYHCRAFSVRRVECALGVMQLTDQYYNGLWVSWGCFWKRTHPILLSQWSVCTVYDLCERGKANNEASTNCSLVDSKLVISSLPSCQMSDNELSLSFRSRKRLLEQCLAQGSWIRCTWLKRSVFSHFSWLLESVYGINRVCW